MKHQLITLCATLVMCTMAGVGIASAQTTPAVTTSATTVAQATAAPKKDPPKQPLAVLHVGGMATYNVGSSDLALPGNYCATTQDCGPTGEYQFADPIAHIDYGIQINLAKGFYLNYAHNYIDQNIGRVGIASKVCSSLPCTAAKEFTIPYTYQKLNDDRVDDASLNYLLDGITISGGWHQRMRMCCGQPFSATLANQVEWHDIYFQLAGRAGPGSKYFGKLFGLTVQEEDIPHNTTSVFKASPSGAVVPTVGSIYHTTVTPNITMPVGAGSTSLALFAQYVNNFDYFLNSPVPYLYNEVDFGFIKKWPPYVTLTVTNSNLYEHHEGYPYSNADTINRNKLIGVLDIALPIR